MMDFNDLRNVDNQQTFYRAVIEDYNDPDKLGRVRVRVLGVHTENLEDLPTDCLPWAEVMVANMFGLNSGVGISAIPLQGTWCWIFFENRDYNKPVVIGLSAGTAVDVSDSEDGFKDPDGNFPYTTRCNEPDMNRLTRNENTTMTIQTDILMDRDTEGEFTAWAGIEPLPLDDIAQYPDCTTIETQSGHVITIDDSFQNERIRFYHPSGTYFEMRPSGAVIYKSAASKHDITTENLYEHVLKCVETIIDEDRYTHIKRNNKYLIDENEDTEIGSNRTEVVKGTQTETVDGAVSEKFNSGQTTNGGPHVTIKAGVINLN